MITRYYEVRECEHGESWPHWLMATTVTGGVVYTKPVTRCPGGQRRELTGVKVATAAAALNDGRLWSVLQRVSGPGRYAIIPLEEI